MKRCIVKSCSKLPQTDKISYFQLPKNEMEREVWRNFIYEANRDEKKKWKFYPRSVLCSRHFEKCCYSWSNTCRKVLIPGHTPSIITDTVGNYKKIVNDHVMDNVLRKNFLIAEAIDRAIIALPEKSTTNLIELQETVEISNDSNLYMDTSMCCSNEIIVDDYQNIKMDMDDTVSENELLLRTIEEQKRTIENLRKDKKKLNRQLNNSRKKLETKSQNSENFSLLGKLKRNSENKSNILDDEIKEFSMKLHYYSPKAYRFVRKSFKGALPHANSLYNWVSKTEVKPGFFDSALKYLKESNKEKKILYSLSMDEVYLRQMLNNSKGKLYGFTDYGEILQNFKPEELASKALFLLATEINGKKKIPLGYILTKGLTSQMIRDVILSALEKMDEVGAEVISITFDGTKANFGSIKLLGGSLDVENGGFAPFMKHPVTKQNVYFVPDAAHMIKLLRNTLKDYGQFVTQEGKVEFKYFEKLAKIQHDSGLRAANKVTIRNVNFEKDKMKVKPAVQLLSNSAATAMEFCEKIKMPEFAGASPTAKFVKDIDRLFDILNSRAFGENFKEPLCKRNEKYWKPFLERMRTVLLNLKTSSGIFLYKTERNTFVIGLLAAIHSVLGLFKEHIETPLNPIITHLPTYRLSQDGLELLFSAIRQRFGCNNNPSPFQLLHALKWMLSVQIDPSFNANCIEQECILIPRMSPLSSISSTEPIMDEINLPETEGLTLFVENIVVYIAGFVAKQLSKQLDCRPCDFALFHEDPAYTEIRKDFTLLTMKSNSGLKIPSESLVKICKTVELTTRRLKQINLKSITYENILKHCLPELLKNEHIFYDLRSEYEADHTPDSNHTEELMKKIILFYSKIRMHHLAKEVTLGANPSSNRTYLNRIINFSGN